MFQDIVKSKLLLHFDINKTIIINDSSIGRNIISGLNSLLSECVWGNYPMDKPKEELTYQDWTPVGQEPSMIAPNPDSVTFGAYLEDHTIIPKAEQRKLKTSFTSLEIGKRFLPALHHIDSALRYDTTLHRDSLPSSLREGYYHILPSFFALINHLVIQGYDFRLLFRTFGTDIAPVVDEFNLFCEGKHPFFKPVFLLDGSSDDYPHDLRLHLPYHIGSVKRTGDGPSSLHLAHVSDNIVQIESGAEKIYDLIYNKHFQLFNSDHHNSNNNNNNKHLRKTFILRDDYGYWHTNHENDLSGKIIFLTKAEVQGLTSPQQCQSTPNTLTQIFFDDNIERNRPHIIDVRQIDTFEPISFEKTQHQLLIKAEPYEAITNINYFIQHIERIISNNK